MKIVNDRRGAAQLQNGSRWKAVCAAEDWKTDTLLALDAVTVILETKLDHTFLTVPEDAAPTEGSNSKQKIHGAVHDDHGHAYSSVAAPHLLFRPVLCRSHLLPQSGLLFRALCRRSRDLGGVLLRSFLQPHCIRQHSPHTSSHYLIPPPLRDEHSTRKEIAA